MSLILWLLIGFVGLLFVLFLVIVFAPFSALICFNNNEKNFRIKYLGYVYEKKGDLKRAGWLFWIKQKSEEEESKPQKRTKKKKGKSNDEKKKKKKEDKSEVSAFFWIKERDILLESLFAVLKSLLLIVNSFRLKKPALTIIVGDGDPMRAGSVYGWLCALDEWLSENVDFKKGYNFYPEAEWYFEFQAIINNNLWRLIIWPLLRLLHRLPKIKLISMYLRYRKATGSN